MIEKPRPTEQTAESFELTHKHWQLMASLDFSVPKINLYALAKANGLIDEMQGPFIGSRHWHGIWSVMREKTTGFAGLAGKILNPTNFRLAEEIKEFAGTETRRVITCDDYYFQLATELTPVVTTYDWEKVYWEEKENKWKHDTVGTVYKYGAPWEIVDTFTASSQDVLNPWLLTESDVDDPIHTPPNELMRIVQEKVPVEKLIERVSHKRPDYQIVAGWEKPIPQDI